jgi:RNA polymerase sigma factor (TIGR02999 family)
VDDVTRVIEATAGGDPNASGELLAIVYDELRRLAAERLRHEAPGQTLQATALVHEAYLRLVNCANAPHWENRGHFFAAAAEAMRRILINRARDKKRLKRRGDRVRLDLENIQSSLETDDDHLVALNEAIEALESHDRLCAQLVKLRFFAGLSLAEAAEALGLAQRTAERQWAYARAWLYDVLADSDSSPAAAGQKSNF